jgi:hypothetical protein
MSEPYHPARFGASAEMLQHQVRTAIDFTPRDSYVVSAFHGPDVPIV